MAVIREMLNRMEAEHKTKLEQLQSMQEQQRCQISLELFSLQLTLSYRHSNPCYYPRVKERLTL